MAVHLKTKTVRREPSSSPLSKSIERALLAVLMYFPNQKSRALASDLIAGNVPLTAANIKKIIKAVQNYGSKRLEFADPAFHVLRAVDALKKFTGKAAPSRAVARAKKKKRVVG